MAVSNKKAIFSSDIQKVWKVVTDVKNYAWRSDLSRTEVLNEKQFVEYTKDGYATTFTITVSEPCKCWEFDMENGNMTGHWKGIFTQRQDGVEIEFIEEVTAKNFLMKPFLKPYIKKQQERFISDLRKALS